MNKSIEVLKAIYKPIKYTIIGKATLLETTSGDFIVKEKNKDLNELYNYLISRNFTSFPKLIDSSRKEVNVFEYIEDLKIPKEQKCDDLIDEVASLHNKTSYFKEVSIDKYKTIYEDIKNNIEYLKNYYNLLYEKAFNEVYMSPSNYELVKNFSKINEAIYFCEENLDEWYDLIKDNNKIRVSVVHNNLSLDHFLNNKIISWDNFLIDTPVIDIVNLYKNEYQNINFSAALEKYLIKFPLLENEEKLLFILLVLPPKIGKYNCEFEASKEYQKVINYIYKTEELIRPYYTKEKKEE